MPVLCHGHLDRVLTSARVGARGARWLAGGLSPGPAQRDRRSPILRRRQPAAGPPRPRHRAGRTGGARGRRGRARSGDGGARGADPRALLWVRCGGRLRRRRGARPISSRAARASPLVALDLGSCGEHARRLLWACGSSARRRGAGPQSIVRTPRHLRAGQPRSWSRCAACAPRWIGAPGLTRLGGLVSEARVLRSRVGPAPGRGRSGPGSSTGGHDAHRLPLRSRRATSGRSRPCSRWRSPIRPRWRTAARASSISISAGSRGSSAARGHRAPAPRRRPRARRGGADRRARAAAPAPASRPARGGDITIVEPGGDAALAGPGAAGAARPGSEMAARLGAGAFARSASWPSCPRGLAERLGGEGARLQRLARGEDATPLRLWTPPPVFEESAEFPGASRRSSRWSISSRAGRDALRAACAGTGSRPTPSSGPVGWPTGRCTRASSRPRRRSPMPLRPPRCCARRSRRGRRAPPWRRSRSAPVPCGWRRAAALRRAAAPEPAPAHGHPGASLRARGRARHRLAGHARHPPPRRPSDDRRFTLIPLSPQGRGQGEGWSQGEGSRSGQSEEQGGRRPDPFSPCAACAPRDPSR